MMSGFVSLIHRVPWRRFPHSASSLWNRTTSGTSRQWLVAPLFQQQHYLHGSQVAARVIKSDLPDVVVPDLPITEFVFRHHHRFGDRPAVINGVTGQEFTFPQLRDAIWRVASGLKRNGIRQKDVVMILSENSVEYIIATHAILSIGATVTMATPIAHINEIQKQVIDSKTSYIIASLLCVSKALEIRDNLEKQIKKVFIVGGDKESCVPFSTLLTDDGSLHSDHAPIDLRRHVAALPYSSGTTGLPKGVMLSHFNEVANATQTDNDFILPVREGAVQLGLLPFYHIYAFIINITALAWGQTLVLLPSFEPKLFLESIRKYRVNMSYVVPPMILFLNKHPLAAAADLSSVTRFLSAAAPLGKESVEEFTAKHPHCTLGQGYGLTEGGPVVCLNPPWDCLAKPASSGKLIPMTELKVVDLEDHTKQCEVGEVGEIAVRGPQVMLGYLNNPKATSDTIDKDGWLYTGDVGYLDNNNHVYISDRAKELIKVKGLQVPPAELEAILNVHPAVLDSCVIGIPDPRDGETPRAFVALKPDAKATEVELMNFVAERVSPYKTLKGGVEFIQQIPRSAAGKVLRKQLKDQHKQQNRVGQ